MQALAWNVIRRQHWFWLGLLWLCIAKNFAAEPANNVSPASLPGPVQQTLRANIGRGKIESIEKSVEDSQLVYEITIRQMGRERDLTIAPSGSLLSKQVFLNEVSAQIQNTIQAHVGDGKLQRIDRTLEEGETFFEVEFLKSGRERSISISPDGKLADAQ